MKEIHLVYGSIKFTYEEALLGAFTDRDRAQQRQEEMEGSHWDWCWIHTVPVNTDLED